MNRRRAFLTHAPVGLASFVAACQSRSRGTMPTAAAAAAGASSASQVARAPIIQLVDPEYTVLVKIEKRRVPAKPS
jgi:hypothetical protein